MINIGEVICERSKEKLTLSNQLSGGAGGEGFIYHVKGKKSLVAKIYKKKITSSKIKKLRYMINNPPLDPMSKHDHMSLAWPKDLIKYNNQVVGFIMPLVKGHNLGIVYFRDQRVKNACHINYIHLHRICYNLAKAFEAAHNSGYIIGDVKDENIKVKDNSLISILDVDSFQVPVPNNHQKFFNCKVLTPEYSPPEVLIYSRKNKVENFRRLPEQDLFGFAILVFKLLMEGTHPFVGFLPSKENQENLEIQERIIKGYFPYQTGGKRGKPPRPAPSFNQLHPGLQKLFIECFVEGIYSPSKRPTIKEWIRALKKAENSLIKCNSNAMHYFSDHLSFCPWCKRKRKFNKDPFPHIKLNKRHKIFTRAKNRNIASKKTKHKTSTSNKKISRTKRQFNSVSAINIKKFIIFFAIILSIFVFYNFGFKIPWITTGHNMTINEVKWSPDGKYILSGCQDGEIHLWDAKTRRHINKFRDESDIVSSLEWSPDGEKFAAGFGRGAIKIWDKNEDKYSHLYEDLVLNIQSLTWLNNHNLFASNSWYSFIINSYNGDFNDIRYNSTGKTIAYLNNNKVYMASVVISENNKELKIHNITDGYLVFKTKLNLSNIFDITISPSKNYISITGNKNLTIVDTKEYLVSEVNYDNDIILLSEWSPKENYIAVVTNSGEIKIYDFYADGLPDGSYLAINNNFKTKYENGFFALDWSPDENKIVTGSRRSDGRLIKDNRENITTYEGDFNDGEIVIWEWKTQNKYVF